MVLRCGSLWPFPDSFCHAFGVIKAFFSGLTVIVFLQMGLKIGEYEVLGVGA